MKAWFMNLAPRERWLLTVAVGVVGLIGIYVLIVEPLVAHKAMLERQISSQGQLLQWMRSTASSSVLQGGGASGGRAESLFALVDRSARATPLAGALQRIQPEGQSVVRIWLDNASFDELVRWLATLERSHGVVVTVLAVDRASEPGKVTARLTLERA